MKIRVGGVPEHFNFPWHYGIEQGIFSKNGIELEWTDFAGGTGAMVQALKDKQIDAALLLTEGAVNAISNELNAKIVQYYVKTPLLWGIHTKGDSEAKTVTDLKGKKIAISRFGSGSHLMSYVMAKKEGWNYEQLSFDVVQNLDGAIKSITERTSALFMWEQFMTEPLCDAGIFKNVGVFPTPWPSFVLVVRNELLINKEDEIRNFQASIFEAVSKTKSLPNLATLIAEKYNLKLESVKTWLSKTKWATDNQIDEDTLDSITDLLYDLKLTNIKKSASKMCSNISDLS